MRIYMYAVALAGLFTLRFLPTYSTYASVPVDAFYLFMLRFLSTYSTKASIASLELHRSPSTYSTALSLSLSLSIYSIYLYL